jgi:acyl-CoA reductase-like NAD-dependent aldehyde dehydrogenase
VVDGSFGEVLTTCEKITWTLGNGEKALTPDKRGVGMLTIHKTAQVEYQPMGVLGAIIPWNYPFHNMLGQVISALYSGNALVLKVQPLCPVGPTLWLCRALQTHPMGLCPELQQLSLYLCLAST